MAVQLSQAASWLHASARARVQIVAVLPAIKNGQRSARDQSESRAVARWPP